MNIVATHLKKHRGLKNMSQETLAEYAGVSVRTVQRIESGKSCSVETGKALASVLSLSSIDDLQVQDAINTKINTGATVEVAATTTADEARVTSDTKATTLQRMEQSILLMITRSSNNQLLVYLLLLALFIPVALVRFCLQYLGDYGDKASDQIVLLTDSINAVSTFYMYISVSLLVAMVSYGVFKLCRKIRKQANAT